LTNNIEILSPAGDMDCFMAAVNNGADAIYLGGSSFSARKSAKNFNNDELIEAVDYAHLRNVKVYVAVNTLVMDDELSDVFEFIKFCYNIGVDALIVQDLGVVYIARKFFPDFPIHASTQMTIHNLSGVKKAENLGFKRVVLSRELSYDEIEYINSNCDAETEVFVHGALCMSYSGQCLFSSMLGGRSGNRGACAQPCRLPYSVLRKDFTEICSNKYFLSLKDLCLVDDVDKLKNIGVSSLKIEGRMKNEEYVAIVTSMYNKYRNNSNVESDDLSMLENIFSRNGFTKGYVKGNTGAHMLNIDRNNDNVYKSINQNVLDYAHELKANKKTIGVDVIVNIHANEKAFVSFSLNGHTVMCESDENVQVALKTPTDKDRIISQISKLGGSPFHINSLSCDVDGDINIPIGQINELRRNCIDKLCKKITHSFKRKSDVQFDMQKASKSPQQYRLSASVKNYEQAIAAFDAGFSIIYIDVDIYSKNKDFFDKHKEIFSLRLPVVMRDGIDYKYDLCNLDNFCISNISQIDKFPDKKLHADYHFNICNSLSANVLKDMGVDSFCASLELTLEQTKNISSEMPTEILVYGRVPLMNVRNCIYKSSGGKCKFDDEYFYIKDRKNKLFPVMTNCFTCTNTIYNSVPLYMGDKMDLIKKINPSLLRFDFTIESPEEIVKIKTMYDTEEKYVSQDFTRGHFFRGIE
jgi:putative protease